MPDDPVLLVARLERARLRAADAPPFSPDWDAAMALIEDIERRLAEVGPSTTDLVREEAGLTTALPI
jgi:hypothetical protein